MQTKSKQEDTFHFEWGRMKITATGKGIGAAWLALVLIYSGIAAWVAYKLLA